MTKPYVLRPFRGSADELEEIWKKFQVVAKIQKWTTAKDRMAHLPLYLSGDAFSAWSELSEVNQEDEAKSKAWLQKYFSMLPGEAYAKFGRRRKRIDESIEVYLADLRRLLWMAGHKIADDGKDPMLLEQFLVGLPVHYARQLRLSIAASTDGLTINAVANQARSLCASGLVTSDGHGMVAAVALSSSRSSSSASQVCFFCQEVGHLRKDCPKRKERIRCYQCKENGHIQRNCPRQMQRKADSADGVVDRPSQDRCLAL